VNPTAMAHFATAQLFRGAASARSPLVLKSRTSAGTTHHEPAPADVGLGPDLADVLSMAIELNRNKAGMHGVRVHCYVLDQATKPEDHCALLNTLDALIGRAIEQSHWGSLVTCQAGITDGEAHFHLRFAVRASNQAASPPGIDWVDEAWSWSVPVASLPLHCKGCVDEDGSIWSRQ